MKSEEIFSKHEEKLACERSLTERRLSLAVATLKRRKDCSLTERRLSLAVATLKRRK